MRDRLLQLDAEELVVASVEPEKTGERESIALAGLGVPGDRCVKAVVDRFVGDHAVPGEVVLRRRNTGQTRDRSRASERPILHLQEPFPEAVGIGLNQTRRSTAVADLFRFQIRRARRGVPRRGSEADPRRRRAETPSERCHRILVGRAGSVGSDRISGLFGAPLADEGGRLCVTGPCQVARSTIRSKWASETGWTESRWPF